MTSTRQGRFLASTDDLPNKILVDSSGKYPQIKKWFMKEKKQDSQKQCIECSGPAVMVRNAAEGMVAKGWYCLACGHFDKVIGRERKL